MQKKINDIQMQTGGSEQTDNKSQQYSPTSRAASFLEDPDNTDGRQVTFHPSSTISFPVELQSCGSFPVIQASGGRAPEEPSEPKDLVPHKSELGRLASAVQKWEKLHPPGPTPMRLKDQKDSKD
eukprot:NODE_6727_length_492_cov_37.801354_g5937_i0.p1 GENE.NODE_6727_length_492_cov_37.801354_g5937_i0~~NODE_6727_length_492_cov_37.801354_g5937_i0.p1  ORF type:complete len:143 (+),score=52.17 NODE_6727_length_492_cov_37.801354_g5937_i0:56-430(+)